MCSSDKHWDRLSCLIINHRLSIQQLGLLAWLLSLFLYHEDGTSVSLSPGLPSWLPVVTVGNKDLRKMDMNLSKLQEIAKAKEVWHAAVRGAAKSETQLSDWRRQCRLDFLPPFLLYCQWEGAVKDGNQIMSLPCLKSSRPYPSHGKENPSTLPDLQHQGMYACPQLLSLPPVLVRGLSILQKQ